MNVLLQIWVFWAKPWTVTVCHHKGWPTIWATGTNGGKVTHIHVNMSCTAFSDPLTVRLCLLSKSWTSEHSHACTEVRPRKSSASPQSQCDPCFVPVLVCVEQSDTELWVVLLWIWRVRLIGPDHKGTSSLQPSEVHPQAVGAMDWSDYMVTKIGFRLQIPE